MKIILKRKLIIVCLLFLSYISVQAQPVKQWSVFEKELTSINEYSAIQKYSINRHIKHVSLSATFCGPQNDTITVNGFWDGGNTWKIRFAPTQPGIWKYTISSNDSILDLPTNDGEFSCIKPTAEDIDKNPNYRGFLKISENKRYFTYADGTPFFWMSGILWSGNDYSMPYKTAFKTYINDRKIKKFSAVQILVGHPAVKSTPDFHHGDNEGGSLFVNDYDEINPNSFQYLDKRIKFITDQGMVPCVGGTARRARARRAIAARPPK